MPDLVDTAALRHVTEQLAQAVRAIAAQAGDVPAVRRLHNDVERLMIDVGDCAGLHSVAPAQPMEVIPDTPYDESLWQGVDDEGIGGFRAAVKPQARPRSRR